MADEDRRSNKELVLAPGTYAYMQEQTKGQVKTYTGPAVINQTAQEAPVVYNAETGTFERVNYLEAAVRKSPIAVEGYYLVLFNPAKDDMGQPSAGMEGKMPPELHVGRRINLPGPTMFPLWPGQHARYIRGHHLRSNQYLVVRIYNEEEARKNWSKAVIKPAATTDLEDGAAPVVTSAAPEDLSVGRMFVIKGTEVSFYIPPTGVTVVQAVDEDTSNAQPDGYVRDALTLEKLEYCILVDESGNKRYERGPQVVFPKPTEKFIAHKGQIKSRAIELNEIQGIHVKVISPYTDDDGTPHKEGEELFITGKQTAIYFPREEHSLISYDGHSKHFATAVPAGEARYVMNRITGEIRAVPGPDMLLPDPRTEVIVRRVLSDNQCALWYPGNNEALSYNQALREVAKQAPTTRSGVVSEGEYARSVKRAMTKGRGREGLMLSADSAVMEKSLHGDAGMDIVADEFSRASTYTQPRTVTLNTKFQGVPSIDIWTGYAVMVISKTGTRHPEVGPKTILLGYDETLEILKLSTGKPKTTDKPYRTAFLRVANNRVSDLVEVETSDHVVVRIKVSYNVNFEGDPQRWWDVENYVKFLCDHGRSVLKNAARKTKIADFYAAAEDFIRDTIVGKKGEEGERPGMVFTENGMKVNDVEVLAVNILDERIQTLLDNHQHTVVRTNIELATGEHNLTVQRRAEEIAQEQFRIKTETEVVRNKLILDKLTAELTTALKQIDNEVQKFVAQAAKIKAEQDNNEISFLATLERGKRQAEQEATIKGRLNDLEKAMIAANTEAVVSRFSAAQQGFTEGLVALSSNEVVAKVAESLSVQHFIGGKNFVDVVQQVFAGSPLEGVVSKISERVSSMEKLAQGSNGGPTDRPRSRV